MRTFALAVAALGGVLLLGTAMIATDQFMTDARKQSIRGDINAALDRNANTYEERKAAGCRRRCFGQLSHEIVSLRDGMFLNRPFDPIEALPYPPDGWSESDYSLPAAQRLFGADLRRSLVTGTTSESRLKTFNHIATSGSYSAALIYTRDDATIAIGIDILRDGVREAKAGNVTPDINRAPVFATLAGIPVRQEKQRSYDWRTNEETPLPYKTLTMDIDGQVKMMIVARAPDADIAALLAQINIDAIIETLPHAPASYTPGQPIATQTASLITP